MSTFEQLGTLADSLPTPVLLGLIVFALHMILIADTGAGAPIVFPLVRRCMKPFRPTKAYERLKSKYVI